MNFSKQKYKAVVVDAWMAQVIYGRTLEELNQKIDAVKANHPNLKAKIYTAMTKRKRQPSRNGG